MRNRMGLLLMLMGPVLCAQVHGQENVAPDDPVAENATGVVKPVDAAAAAAPEPIDATSPIRFTTRPHRPGQFINSVSVSADGTRVFAGTYRHEGALPAGVLPALGDYRVSVFDGSGGLTWERRMMAHEGVYATAMAPSGLLAASSGWYSMSPRTGFVHLHRVDDGTPLIEFRSAMTRVGALAMAADTSATVAGSSNVLYVFEQVQGAFRAMPVTFLLPDPDTMDDRSERILRLVISADGSRILAGTQKGLIHLLARTPGTVRLVQSLRVGGPVRSLVWSNDESVVVAGVDKNEVVALAPDAFAVTGKPAWTARFDGTTSVPGVAVSTDGAIVMAVGAQSKSGFLGRIDPRSKPGRWTWQVELDVRPNALAMNTSADRLAIAAGTPDKPGAFVMFDAADGREKWRQATGNMNWTIAFARDGDLLVGGSDDGRVYAFAGE